MAPLNPLKKYLLHGTFCPPNCWMIQNLSFLDSFWYSSPSSATNISTSFSAKIISTDFFLLFIPRILHHKTLRDLSERSLSYLLKLVVILSIDDIDTVKLWIWSWLIIAVLHREMLEIFNAFTVAQFPKACWDSSQRLTGTVPRGLLGQIPEACWDRSQRLTASLWDRSQRLPGNPPRHMHYGIYSVSLVSGVQFRCVRQIFCIYRFSGIWIWYNILSFYIGIKSRL